MMKNMIIATVLVVIIAQLSNINVVVGVTTSAAAQGWAFSDDFDIYDPTSLQTAMHDQKEEAAAAAAGSGAVHVPPLYVPQLRATEGAYFPISTFKQKHDRSTLFPSIRTTPASHLTPEEIDTIKEAARTPVGELPTAPSSSTVEQAKRPIRSGLSVFGSSHLSESYFFAADDLRYQKWHQAEEVRLAEARKKLITEYARLRKEAADSYQDALDEEESPSSDGGSSSTKSDEKVLALVQPADEILKRSKRRTSIFRSNTSSLKDRMTSVALDIRGVMKRLRGAFFPHPYVSSVRGTNSPPAPSGRHRLSKTEQGLPSLRDTLVRFHVDDHMVLNYQLNKTARGGDGSASIESEEDQYERLLYGADSYGLSGLIPGASSSSSSSGQTSSSSSAIVPALTQRDYDLSLFALLRPTSFFDTVAATDDAAAALANGGGDGSAAAADSDASAASSSSFVLGNGNIKASESPLHTQTFQAGRNNVLTAAKRATFVPSSTSPDGIVSDTIQTLIQAGRRVVSIFQVAFRAILPTPTTTATTSSSSSLGEVESGLDFPSLLSVPFFDASDAEKLSEEYAALARDAAILETDLQNMERGSYRLDVLARATRNVQQGVSGDDSSKSKRRRGGRASSSADHHHHSPDAATSEEAAAAELQTRIDNEVVILSQTAPSYYRNLRAHYMAPQITSEINRFYTALYFNQRVQWSLVHSSYPVLHKDILPSIQAAADELSGKMKMNDESTKAKRAVMKDHTMLYKRMTAEIKKLEGLLRHCRRLITHYDIQSKQSHRVATAGKPAGLDMMQLVDLVKWSGIARRHRDVLGAALRLPDSSEAALAKLDQELSKEDTTSRRIPKKSSAKKKSVVGGGMDFSNVRRPWEGQQSSTGEEEESLYATSISTHTADATTFRIFGLSQYELLAIAGSIVIPVVLDAALIQSPIRLVALLQWCASWLLPWLSGRRTAKGKVISKLINKKSHTSSSSSSHQEEDDPTIAAIAKPQKSILVRVVSLWVVLLGLWVRLYVSVGHFLIPLVFPVFISVDSFERWILQGTTQLRGLVTGSGVASKSGVAGSGSSPHIGFTTQVLITRSQFLWLYLVMFALVSVASLVVLRPVFTSAAYLLHHPSSRANRRK